MPITYPIELPTDPGFTEVIWRPISAVVRQEHEFTLTSKIYAWEGQTRSVTIRLPPLLTLAQARLWCVWALKLNGAEGTFLLSDETIRRITGTCPVSFTGASIATGGGGPGDLLQTTGWPTSETGYLKAGDMISIQNRLYTLLEDMDTDGAGAAEIQVWPIVRTAIPNATAISVGNSAKGLFQLIDFPEFGWDVERVMREFQFAAREAI
jgi:hypothetical protein